jgi:hypothetical protein
MLLSIRIPRKMLTIAKLFGKSPFAPLQSHIDKVACCIGELPGLFKVMIEQNEQAIEKVSGKISRLEHEADLTKHDIRNHLPRSLFLPVDRESILEILDLQDAIADQAEKIGHRATMRRLELLEDMREDFSLLCEKNMEVFWLCHKVIKEMEELLESLFGGIEAEKVKGMIDQIAFYKYEIDNLQNRLLKRLYQKGESLPVTSFHLCYSLIEEIGCIAQLSETLGHRVRMLLELK